jgi:hypothetical protein
VSGPIVPVVLAALLVWAGSVIEDGWRRKRAERSHPLRALGRICERRNN